MSEVDSYTSILIATSYQALIRAKHEPERTRICNCAVVIVFAAFFIEANLNHIIQAIGMDDDLTTYCGSTPGLGNKLAWFYNKFVAKSQMSRREFNNTNLKKKLYKRLNRKFIGFNKIQNFRNNLSHGIIDSDFASLLNAKKLRQNAKNIVDELFKMVGRAGHSIERGTTYDVAIRELS